MATTLRTLIAKLVRDPHAAEAHVHFHRGPQGMPAACHDADCPNPQLEI
jgi:hypothetical protein